MFYHINHLGIAKCMLRRRLTVEACRQFPIRLGNADKEYAMIAVMRCMLLSLLLRYFYTYFVFVYTSFM